MRSRTWLILALCAGCGQIPCALVAQEGFREPRINGKRLDWCLGWGKECGQPAADEFCRRKGYKAALRFEVAHAVGPTQVISSGETCTIPACDAFAYITCTQVPRPAERDRGQPAVNAPQPSEKAWRYDVLARDKVIRAEAIPANARAALFDTQPIDVAGFRTARLFVHVLPVGGDTEPGALGKAAKLHVTGLHDAPNGWQEYFEGELPMRGASSLGGWIEIPIVGPVLRIAVAGDHLPKLAMRANCTLYLLK